MSVRELTEEEVSCRISARKSAETVAALADEEAKIYGKVFWEKLHKICCAYVPCKKEEVPTEGPMSPDQAKRFGREVMPFGMHKGDKVDEVPLDMLSWYADQRFTDDLRRYLKSERIQKEDEFFYEGE